MRPNRKRLGPVQNRSDPRIYTDPNLYALTAYWGDNQSKLVAQDDYSHHVASPPIWMGLHNVAVPPPGPAPWNADVSGDPTSFHCAHTFFLYAWDRVINGWGYIHGAAGYHKSITLMF